MRYFILLLWTLICAQPVFAEGNIWNESFNKSKKMLLEDVYRDHRLTFYCEAAFDARGQVTPPEGFTVRVHAKRAVRVEWEHVVPAENFGRTFAEWREGHAQCVDGRGKAFRGRKCAEKTNPEYRRMQADMYNLYPSIGAVNAVRRNYNFQMLPGATAAFGSCAMKIDGTKVEPPAPARGAIARTYKYMAAVYPRYQMSRQQRQLMDAWDRQYPVDAWECRRAARIARIQGNENPFVAVPCRRASLEQMPAVRPQTEAAENLLLLFSDSETSRPATSQK